MRAGMEGTATGKTERGNFFWNSGFTGRFWRRWQEGAAKR